MVVVVEEFLRNDYNSIISLFSVKHAHDYTYNTENTHRTITCVISINKMVFFSYTNWFSSITVAIARGHMLKHHQFEKYIHTHKYLDTGNKQNGRIKKKKKKLKTRNEVRKTIKTFWSRSFIRRVLFVIFTYYAVLY